MTRLAAPGPVPRAAFERGLRVVSEVPQEQRPLVVTLQLERSAQERFEAERAELFPPGRTAVGAHVTLFHALPATLRQDVETELARAAAVPPFAVGVTEVFSLGRGVAYRLAAEEAQRLHRVLQCRWRPHLTRQDAQPLRPHLTVQNKVAPEVARATLDRLRADFRPEVTRAVGLELWRYDGGPWSFLRRWQLGSVDERREHAPDGRRSAEQPGWESATDPAP